MTAIVLEKNGEMAIKEVPTPDSPEDWALVKVDAAGICGSDIPRAFYGGAYHYPLIMGHEFAGTVEDVPTDDNANGIVSRGERVAVIPLLPCYACTACESQSYAQCESYDYLGSRRDGGFAQYVRVPLRNLIPVPDNVPQHHAAMTEPCAVALHGVKKLPIEPGSTAIVYGAGPIGNLAAQWLRVRGSFAVTLVDVDERKLDIARDMGFGAINPGDGDPVEQYLQNTSGRGAAAAVEACGLPLTFRQSLASVVRGGSVLFLGNINGEFTLGKSEFSAILRKELKIFGTWNSTFSPRGTDDWTVSLAAMGRSIDVESLISHRVPLVKAPDAFYGMYNREGFYSKVIIHPGETV